MLQDLSVGDTVLPPDVQQVPKAAEGESVESGIGHPRLTAIKESQQDTSLVDANLGPFAQQVIAPHSLVAVWP